VSSWPVTGPPYDHPVTTLARSERLALADLLDDIGPDAPTLCGDWTTRDLAAHLVVRERRPDATPGVAVKAFAGWTEQVQDSYAERPYGELVELVRTGPGRLSPFSLPGVDKLLNTSEYAVHHEDVRRAQRGWTPRDLPARVQDSLWKVVTSRAPLSLRGVDATVVLRRSDKPRAHPSSHGSGSSTVTLTGEPMELLLHLFGRREHAQVVVSGDPDAIAALERHSLSV
jgi:uncharacterized protein (TIGR03085 family)